MLCSVFHLLTLEDRPFSSQALFPAKDAPLPPSMAAVAPLVSSAHPLITALSCAALHPADPSCARTFLTSWLHMLPPTARLFFAVNAAFALAKPSRLYHDPVATIRAVLAHSARASTFVTGAISTAWASICFFQVWLPRRFLATQRFFLGGFVAGLWAWVARRSGRDFFIYTARASTVSLWQVGIKRRWWRAVWGGDVWVFVLAVMLSGIAYERDARAVREPHWRKGISWVRGEGWRDWAVEEEDDEEEDGRDQDGHAKDE